LLHEDIIGKASMEESSLHIEAHDLEVIVIGKSKEESNAAEFHDGGTGIRFTIILWTLTKTLRDKTSLFLTTYDRSVRMVLVVVGPSNANCFTTWRKGRLFESLSGFQTVEFPLHRSQPNRVVWSVSGLMIGIRGFGKVPRSVTKEGKRSRKEAVIEEGCVRGVKIRCSRWCDIVSDI
jgi:hypothetical protein